MKPGRKPGSLKTPGSGRQKGVPNTITREFKGLMTEILFGQPDVTTQRLVDLRDSEDVQDRATFWRIASKMLPSAVQVEVKRDVLVTLDFSGGEDGSKGQRAKEGGKQAEKEVRGTVVSTDRG